MMIDTVDIVCLVVVGIIFLIFLGIDLWGMYILIKRQIKKVKENK